eukprot:2714223-Prymnesium_polylepis.1
MDGQMEATSSSKRRGSAAISATACRSSRLSAVPSLSSSRPCDGPPPALVLPLVLATETASTYSRCMQRGLFDPKAPRPPPPSAGTSIDLTRPQTRSVSPGTQQSTSSSSSSTSTVRGTRP